MGTGPIGLLLRLGLSKSCGFGARQAHPGRQRSLEWIRMATQAPKPPTPPRAPDLSPGTPAGGDSVVLERRPEKVKPPQMYQVVLLNDDYTPMEFVVVVIQEFFNKDRETATQIMLKIHLDGKGVCGVFSKDVAATKVDQVTEAARKHGHPLQCISEPLEL
jgi:ATP-dependent Clp protease adaptor protein ClpS